MTAPAPERRPLNSRNSRWAHRAAARLAARGVAPNRISQASMGFAALAFAAFWGVGEGVAPQALLLIGALCVQGRLVCNLLDGMVAVEGGLKTSDGPFWNEAPDRLADALILGGLGLAAGQAALGLLAASLAIATAYLRELGRAEGLPGDYSGPMAKPHRMATVTVGAVAAAVEVATLGSTLALTLALWAIVIGTVATILRRSVRILNGLRARG